MYDGIGEGNISDSTASYALDKSLVHFGLSQAAYVLRVCCCGAIKMVRFIDAFLIQKTVVRDGVV